MSGEPSGKSARDRADDGRAAALERIEDVHNSKGGPAEVAPAEQEAIDDFADVLADALLDGLRGSDTAAYIGPVADSAKYYNKTDIQTRFQDAVEERENVG